MRLGFYSPTVQKRRFVSRLTAILRGRSSSQDRDDLIPRMKRFMRDTVETANRESLMDNMLRLRSKKWHAYCNRCSQPQKRLLNLITV
jgi:hypothetical protein